MTTQKTEIPAEDLIKILSEENAGNFREIVVCYHSYVYSLAIRFLNNCSDAEDILQESFIRVWKYRNKYKQEIKFTTWLYRIVLNLCYDKIKSRKRRANVFATEPDMDQFSGSLNSPITDLDNKERSDLILSLAEELSIKQKMVFTLRDLQNLSISETADILKISEESVKTNLVYARRALKEKLAKYYR